MKMIAAALLLQATLATSADTTVHQVTYVDILPASAKAMVTAFTQYRDASRGENGYVRFELLEQIGRPGRYVVLEAWRDQAAYDAHANAPHVKTYRDALQTIRISGYDQRPYKVLTVGQATPDARAGGMVHVVSHVDFAGAGAQAQAPGLMTKIAEASRKEPGNLRFEVLQGATRANHYTVVETWQNQAAADAHAAAVHTKEYRDALTPITGSPLDENIYRRVE